MNAPVVFFTTELYPAIKSHTVMQSQALRSLNVHIQPPCLTRRSIFPCHNEPKARSTWPSRHFMQLTQHGRMLNV